MIDDFLLDTILDYYFDNKAWFVLPIISANSKPIAMNKRSETARKAVIFAEVKFIY